MTPQERKVFELALDALEKIATVNAMDYEYQQWAKEYLAAIKEALAQPEQEPVAWYIREKDSATTDGCWAENNLDICEPLYTTPQPDKLAYYEKVADDLQALCDKQSLRIAELEKSWIGLNWDDLPEIYVGDKTFLHGAQWAETKLREKNT